MGRSAIVAIAAAGVALVLAIITAVVVLGRTPAAAGGSRVLESRAGAEEVVALLDPDAVQVTPTLTGLAPKDPAVLGLAPGDELRSLGGRPLRSPTDLRLNLRTLARAQVPALLFEVGRGDELHVLRVTIDGDLTEALRARAGTTPTPTGADPADPDPAVIEQIRAGITKVDDEHVTITRAAFDLARTDPAGVVRQARVIPYMRNGTSAGLKLYAIRPSSIFAAIGLHNGDAITAVNGQPLAGIDEAVALVQDLAGATDLHLAITRRGRDVELHIAIR